MQRRVAVRIKAENLDEINVRQKPILGNGIQKSTISMLFFPLCD